MFRSSLLNVIKIKNKNTSKQINKTVSSNTRDVFLFALINNANGENQRDVDVR